ncbi:MAG: hypothetical protein AABN33_26425 [Acidobacteriota bacterium]
MQPASRAVTTMDATALSLRAIQLYAPKGRSEEVNRRLAGARKWLESASPKTNEDRAFHLFGLAWSNADKKVLRKAANQLKAEQRGDGGWAQIPTMESDAFAIGQALVALHRAGGLPVSDSAYQRGVQYLLKTWKPDGSRSCEAARSHAETIRKRIPVWKRPVDFRRRHQLGCDGVGSDSRTFRAIQTIWANDWQTDTLVKIEPREHPADTLINKRANLYDETDNSIRIFVAAFDSFILLLDGANRAAGLGKDRGRNDEPLSGDFTLGHEQSARQ